MDDMYLVLLLAFCLLSFAAHTLTLALLGCGYVIFRVLKFYAGFLAWRFSSKRMRQEVAVSYMFAVAYTSVFLFGLSEYFFDTWSSWLMCAILWPLSMWAVVDDHRSYITKIARFSKPA